MLCSRLADRQRMYDTGLTHVELDCVLGISRMQNHLLRASHEQDLADWKQAQLSCNACNILFSIAHNT